MMCKELFVFVALLAIVAAAVQQGPKHPPDHHQDHDHHDHHDHHHDHDHHDRDHNDNDHHDHENNENDHHDHEHHDHDHHDHDHHDHNHHDHDDNVLIPANPLKPEVPPKETLPVQEEIAEEDGNQDKDVEDTVDEDVNEDAKKMLKIRQEETEGEEVTVDELRDIPLWVDCDYSVIPRASCHDCRTRVFCKYEGGGKLVTCNNPAKPYCYNGYCSAVPRSGCA